MSFEWIAIALNDVSWVAVAFALGLVAKWIGLPPLVGFLAAGFVLNATGAEAGSGLDKLSDLGITLLLFTVGLKLRLGTLARPQVWAVTTIHTTLTVAIFSGLILLLAALGMPMLNQLEPKAAVLLAFAMSFSSTVFVVKVLEQKGESKSLHGRIAIGVLIMQDVFAVTFLALSIAKVPSIWSLGLLLLIPLRHVLFFLLKLVQHGELLVLYGFVMALGGAELFEMVGLKGDLGALVIGVLLAQHARSAELAWTMLSFKDLFLVGFFLLIGFSGQPTLEMLLIAGLMALLVAFKSTLLFALFALFRMRARTTLLATINLSNYSEFGLIVLSISIAQGWLPSSWLTTFSIAVALSFAIAAVLNKFSHRIYSKHRDRLRQLQTTKRLADDRLIDMGEATIAIIGMGRVGEGAYDEMRELHGDTVIGIDFDPGRIKSLQKTGRRVLLGDPSDTDFWDRMTEKHALKLLMLALPKNSMNLLVLDEIKQAWFKGTIAVAARYPDEVESLKKAGATTVFNIYHEAGTGFALHVEEELKTTDS